MKIAIFFLMFLVFAKKLLYISLPVCLILSPLVFTPCIAHQLNKLNCEKMDL